MVTSSKVGVVPDGVDIREGVVFVSTRVGPRGRGKEVVGSGKESGYFFLSPRSYRFRFSLFVQRLLAMRLARRMCWGASEKVVAVSALSKAAR